ncbi:hypothetical protein M0802_003955 [Mischocyttarus mexicanus]|nr:hypothetical protein M0802_003955 [Mischocyttarus mexicanus]
MGGAYTVEEEGEEEEMVVVLRRRTTPPVASVEERIGRRTMTCQPQVARVSSLLPFSLLPFIPPSSFCSFLDFLVLQGFLEWYAHKRGDPPDSRTVLRVPGLHQQSASSRAMPLVLVLLLPLPLLLLLLLPLLLLLLLLLLPTIARGSRRWFFILLDQQFQSPFSVSMRTSIRRSS